MKRWCLLLLVCLVLVPVVCAAPSPLPHITDPHLTEFAVNASGGSNITGDYSGAEQIFLVTPPSGETWIISRLIVHIEDFGTMDTNNYGNMITLTNGVIIRSNISGVVKNLTDHNIRTNSDWGMYSYDVAHITFGTGPEIINVRWTFSKAGSFIKLEEGDSLQIVVNDDFTGLDDHFFQFQGYIDDERKGILSGETAIIIFVLTVTLLIFMLPHFFKQFTGNFYLDTALKGCCYIIGIFLLSLDAAIVSSVSKINALGVESEIFNFMFITNWAGYIAIVFVVLRYTHQMILMWHIKKQKKRLGIEDE